MPEDLGVLVAHPYKLVAEALCRFLSSHSGLSAVGMATDGLTALELALAESPDVALLHIECLFAEGVRVDKRLKRHGIPSLVFGCREDARVSELGLDRGPFTSVNEPAASLVTAIRRFSATSETSRGQQVPRRGGVPRITPREASVLGLVVEGRSSKEISHELGLSVRTINNHRARLMKKFAVRSSTGLVRAAVLTGVIEL